MSKIGEMALELMPPGTKLKAMARGPMCIALWPSLALLGPTLPIYEVPDGFLMKSILLLIPAKT